MTITHDLIIVGGGFGGALLSMVAKKLGQRPVLIERGHHPRFAIGESSTPLANLLLADLCDRYHLSRISPLTKWGTWQENYPELPVGLKRGFTFYHHGGDDIPSVSPRDSTRDKTLLVAASPSDRLADTHWYRPSFDQFLAQEAIQLGVDYRENTMLQTVEWMSSGVGVIGFQNGRPVKFCAPWIVDATGPNGFLAQKLKIPPASTGSLTGNQGLFGHFKGVRNMSDLTGGIEGAPYPEDASATHHCFPGGWIWVLPFNHGITSAGASVSSDLAKDLRFSEGQPAWDRLLGRLPWVRRQFETSTLADPFRHSPELAYCTTQAAGKNWAVLPSAAGFADPLLSTGFALTLSGIQLLAKMMENGHPPTERDLMDYGARTVRDQQVVQLLVAALHRHLGRPTAFNALLMLYFAAVSYAESALRLNKRHLAPGFLLNGRPDFWPPVEALLRRCLTQVIPTTELEEEIRSRIACVNVGGWLAEPGKRFYQVDLEALIQQAGLLGSSAEEIRSVWNRM